VSLAVGLFISAIQVRPSGKDSATSTAGAGDSVITPPPQGTVPTGQFTWPWKRDPAGSVRVAVCTIL
jgi:hypothetical protein